jgi:hypothetical protein
VEKEGLFAGCKGGPGRLEEGIEAPNVSTFNTAFDEPPVVGFPGSEGNALPIGAYSWLTGFGNHQHAIVAIGISRINVIRPIIRIENREDEPAW